MDAIRFDWPYLGLAIGLAGLAFLALRSRPPAQPHRWRDPEWLVCLMLPVYMVHQFEEHAVDLLGRHYHFIVDMCSALRRPPNDCPADPAFVLAVNAGAVWIAGLTAILRRRTAPLVGACAIGLPWVNGMAHLGAAISEGSYNSGLLTGIVLFLPGSIVILRGLVRANAIRPRDLPLVAASGIIVHVVLLGALLVHEAGYLPYGLMLFIETANGLVPLGIAAAAKRIWAARIMSLPPPG